VLGFFSSRRNCGSPTSSPDCSPPLLVPGRGGTLTCRRGGGGVPIPTRGPIERKMLDVINVKQVLPTTPPHRLSMTMVQLGVSCSTSYSLYLAVTTTFLQQQVVPQLFVPELFVPELFVPELLVLELIISKACFAVNLSCSNCLYCRFSRQLKKIFQWDPVISQPAPNSFARLYLSFQLHESFPRII
jgi:hypothetical protein